MSFKRFLTALAGLRQEGHLQYEPWDDNYLKKAIRKAVIEELVENIGRDGCKVVQGEPLVYFGPVGYSEGEGIEEVTSERFKRILGELNQDPLLEGVALKMQRTVAAAYGYLHGVRKLNWVATIQFDSEDDHSSTLPGNMSDKLNHAVNLTPHDVVLVDAESGEIMTFPATGHSLRVEFAESKVSTAVLGGTKVEIVHGPRVPVNTNYNDLPDELQRAPAIIVSNIVAEAIWDTHTNGVLLFVPDTGPESVVRDDKGQIKGVKRFILYDGAS